MLKFFQLNIIVRLSPELPFGYSGIGVRLGAEYEYSFTDSHFMDQSKSPVNNYFVTPGRIKPMINAKTNLHGLDDFRQPSYKL